jgi:hypothetical protein
MAADVETRLKPNRHRKTHWNPSRDGSTLISRVCARLAYRCSPQVRYSLSHVTGLGIGCPILSEIAFAQCYSNGNSRRLGVDHFPRMSRTCKAPLSEWELLHPRSSARGPQYNEHSEEGYVTGGLVCARRTCRCSGGHRPPLPIKSFGWIEPSPNRTSRCIRSVPSAPFAFKRRSKSTFTQPSLRVRTFARDIATPST